MSLNSYHYYNIYCRSMGKLFLIFILAILFSCVKQKNNVETGVEKSIFSNEELKILEPHFESDTNVKEIKAIKIQTH